MQPNFGPIELMVILVAGGLLFSSILLAALGVIDAARRPEPDWARAGQSKGLWIALMAVGAWSCPPIGITLAIVYLTSIRPKLEAAGKPREFGLQDL